MADRKSPPNQLGSTTPLAPPLYQASTYVLPDLDTLDRIIDGGEPGFFYARDSHPNARLLAAEVAGLEGATWSVVCGSGMAAISSVLLATLEPGQGMVASNRLYGRTTELLGQELSRFGVKTTFVDAGDLDAVRAALASPTRLMLVETMSNPLLRLVDVERLAELAHERSCRLFVDNTFATPELVKPLELGADFVMESLTKMLGGHSDVTLGVVAGRGELPPELPRTVSIWGLASNPFDCWMTARGLASFPLRMRAACVNAAALSDWLAGHSGVLRTIYPGRPEHPDHPLARRLLRGGFGNMLSFELDGGRQAVNRFMQRSGIPFSPSLGHTTTTLSHPASTSHRYFSPAEKARQGISDGLIRLSVGFEELARIREELAKGLT